MKLSNLYCKKTFNTRKVLPFSIIGVVIVLGLAAWLFTRQNTNKWERVEKVASLSNINLIIDTHIRLSPTVTWESISEKLTATKVKKIIVYKFNSADTCGFAGCLYVLSDGYAKSKALQLWDEPFFRESYQAECLQLDQKGKDYQICL